MIVLRHPPVHAPGLCYGRFDPPLPDDLESRVRRVLPKLAAVRSIVCSPLQRCALPARMIGEALEVTVLTDERLQELDFGDWEGRRWNDIDRRASDHWAADPLRRAPPGGETFEQLCERVGSAVADAASLPSPLVITHAGPIRALWFLLDGISFGEAFATRVPYFKPLSINPPQT